MPWDFLLKTVLPPWFQPFAHTLSPYVWDAEDFNEGTKSRDVS